jgi:DNA polymerase III subunit epsilon
MRLRHRFWLTVAGFVLLLLLLIGGWAALLWAQLDPAEQQALAGIFARRPVYPAVLVALLLLATHGVLRALSAAYPEAARRVADETRIILTANPSHRIAAEGAEEIRSVGERINAMAEQHQQLLREVEARVTAAQAALAEERNRLAALISELAQGVIVCNREGRILLYNQRARQILHSADDESGEAGLVGLGRSLYGLFDSAAIEHALETLLHRRERGEEGAVARFVTYTRTGLLLRIHLTPVVDAEGTMTGFVLTVEDVTRRIEADRQRDTLLQSLTEGIRAPLASIRAAIEMIEAFPGMEPEQLHRFQAIIRDETLTLSERLEDTLSRHAEHLKVEWPLEPMLAGDLLAALERSFATWAGVATRARHASEALWLRVDSYALVLALTRLMKRVHDEEAVEEATLDIERAERFARLDLIWSGRALDADTLREWQRQPLAKRGYGATLTLAEVIERHGGAAWSQCDRTTGRAYFRLFLPHVEREEGGELRVERASRPEFYDFDLFAQPGQDPELDRLTLAELAYTVFDTETTGLNPSEGDEIIAIGAVRIVNARLLRDEIFDQRINPRRRIAPESQAIHGISNEMLRDEPPLEVVLPRFHRFAEDAVLVGHNAAFDMRFLQLAESRARVRFGQPVLDTLLLSAVAQPEQDDHSLDAIAARFGIPVIGRHTSLGDAILTGQIFLKLVPLLAAEGITTLGEAREASQQTMLARIQY